MSTAFTASWNLVGCIFICCKIFYNFPCEFFFDPLLFKSMLFILYNLWIFPFSFCYSFLVSFFVVGKNTFYDLDNLLRHVLWPNTWSIWGYVPCTLEKMCILLCNGVFCICLLHLVIHVLFKSSVSLLILCLVLSIIDGELLEFPSIIELSSSLCNCVNVWFMYFGAVLLVCIGL